jgi:hypothetical protein
LDETVDRRIWDRGGFSDTGRRNLTGNGKAACVIFGRCAVNQFFKEYGEMILAAAGAFAMFLLFRRMLLSPSGELAQLVLLLEKGGI